MAKKKGNFKFDFKPLGLGIKRGREAKDITREKLAEMVNYSSRYLQSVEIEGKIPSTELLIQLVTLLDVSVDEHLFKGKQPAISSVRRRVNTLLDGLTDKELIIIEGAAKGLYQAREFSDR